MFLFGGYVKFYILWSIWKCGEKGVKKKWLNILVFQKKAVPLYLKSNNNQY